MTKDSGYKIFARGLKKSFGTKQVLKDVDVEVATGESLVIIGGSGSGKSVLLKTLLGLMQTDAGSIKIDGCEVAELSGASAMRARSGFAMLFQNSALFDSLSVWENIAFGLIHAEKMPRRRAREIALEKLGQVGLDKNAADLWPADLSGGMRKRVSLARAIATNPALVMFDEPTTGLDPIMSNVINELIVSTVRDIGATAVSITHDMESARTIASRIAMIYDGRIIWSGLPSELETSGNEHVEQFVHGRIDGPIVAQTRA